MKLRTPAALRARSRLPLLCLGAGLLLACGDVPVLGGCFVFPRSDPWNQVVADLPRHPRSSEITAAIGADASLRADFGEDQTAGIPYALVPEYQALVPIAFDESPKESDPGPYPIPPNVPIESGSDLHVLILQTGACRLYELYNARRAGSSWVAGSGAIFPLTVSPRRPAGFTSADAAGLPILPGLVRYDEVASGAIHHALRFTVPRTRAAYIAPATHATGNRTDETLPPMGLRLRLRADFDLSRVTGAARVILTALQRYGMFVADNGSAWFLTGAPDPHWSDDDLRQLRQARGSDFEVVYTGEPQPL